MRKRRIKLYLFEFYDEKRVLNFESTLNRSLKELVSQDRKYENLVIHCQTLLPPEDSVDILAWNSENNLSIFDSNTLVYVRPSPSKKDISNFVAASIQSWKGVNMINRTGLGVFSEFNRMLFLSCLPPSGSLYVPEGINLYLPPGSAICEKKVRSALALKSHLVKKRFVGDFLIIKKNTSGSSKGVYFVEKEDDEELIFGKIATLLSTIRGDEPSSMMVTLQQNFRDSEELSPHIRLEFVRNLDNSCDVNSHFPYCFEIVNAEKDYKNNRMLSACPCKTGAVGIFDGRVYESKELIGFLGEKNMIAIKRMFDNLAIDVAAIEFFVNRSKNQITVFDINLNTNYNKAIEEKTNYAASKALIDLILARSNAL